MSTATIANLIVVFGLLVAAERIARWLYRRDRAATARHQRFLAETVAPPPLPMREVEPGINLADWDECELIYGMPSYREPDLDAGLDRLRAAIREQQKGEQA